MSSRPAKKQSLPNRIQRQNLSSDARFIVALLKKQPQTRDELFKSANLPSATFYAVIRLLKKENIIQTIDSEYALWFYKSLEKELIEIFDKYENEGYLKLNTKIILKEVVRPYWEIESTLYSVAHKYGAYVFPAEDGQTYVCKGSRKPRPPQVRHA